MIETTFYVHLFLNQSLDSKKYNLPAAEFNETPLREYALGFPLRSYIEEAAVRTVVRTTVKTAER